MKKIKCYNCEKLKHYACDCIKLKCCTNDLLKWWNTVSYDLNWKFK